MDGRMPSGRTLIVDDHHYYMASVLAEHLHGQGIEVVFVTSGDKVATWCDNTGERIRVQRRLMELDIEIVTGHDLQTF